MPNTSLYLTVATSLALSLGMAKAQTTFDVSNSSSDLSSPTSWTPSESDGQTPPPTGNDNAEFDSHAVTTPGPLIDSFYTDTSLSAGSIHINSWNSTIMVNTNGAVNTNNNTITLIGNPSITTTGAGLDIGNLNINPAAGSGSTGGGTGSTFSLDNQLTITGALGTAAGTATTVTVNDGGPLNLIGNSSAGQLNTGSSTASGVVNLTFQNGSNVTLGHNNTQTFGLLTINGNTSLTEDNSGTAHGGSVAGGDNLNNESAFAITTKTQETFTGGLNIQAGKLTIYGWQGPQLGMTSSAGQLLFNPTGLTTGTELTNVIFDLASNNAGPTGSTYDPANGSQYDYGEWIVDPTNSSLDELVPYAAVPEPSTILGGLVLLGALGWRERRRLTALGFFAKA